MVIRLGLIRLSLNDTYAGSKGRRRGPVFFIGHKGDLMKSKTLSLCSLLVLAVFTTPVLAEEDMFYLGLHAATVYLEETDMKKDAAIVELDFDPSYGGWGVLGYDLGYGRLELEAGIRNASIDKARTGSGVFDPGGEINSKSFMFNSFADYNDVPGITPFFMVGVGAAMVEVEEDLSLGFTFADHTDEVFAYQAGLGVGLPFSNSLTADLQYRYFATLDPEFEASDGSDIETEYATHNVSFGLRYAF